MKNLPIASPRASKGLPEAGATSPEAPACAGALLVDARRDFPGLSTAEGKPWHYLDTAATAQKPRAVIDAMARAMGEDYATVHRGVYARSAEMTLAYEAARRTVARFIGGSEEELISLAAPRKRSILSPGPGAGRTSRRGTASCCRKPSTIRTSCPGRWWPGRSAR